MPIKHAFTSAKADGGDATLVRPSDWNADHDGSVDPANIVYLESNAPGHGAFGAVWDTIYDQEQNEIGSPAAIGISLVDGDSRVRIDEAGLYWFELMAQPTNDDTAQVDILLHAASVDYSGGPRIRLTDVVAGTVEGCVSAMVSVPAANLPGYVYALASAYGAAPTADPYEPWFYGVLKIVRLA